MRSTRAIKTHNKQAPTADDLLTDTLTDTLVADTLVTDTHVADPLPSNARNALRQMQSLSSRIAIVNEITELINRNLNQDQILRVVRQYAKWLLEYDHLSVTLKHREGGWQVHTLYGETPEHDRLENTDDNTVAFVIRTRRTKLIDSGVDCTLFPEMGSLICIPLTYDDDVIGTLNFAQRDQNVYSLEDVRIAYLLALQLASALRNAAQLDQLERVEESLKLYARQLELRNDELDWFNAMIAHDLKAPLSVIYGYVSLLELVLDMQPGDESKKYTQAIFDSAQGMNRMILRLLEMTRVQQTKEQHPVNLSDCTDKALERFKLQLERRTIPLNLVIQADMPQVIGYDVWIEEILANLIGNAIKYIGDENAAPQIEVVAYPVDNDDPRMSLIRIEVRDNGHGMDEEATSKIFQSFERAGGKGEGHGLGLYIVQRFVTQLGGQVGVESEPGVGSTFWFTLRTA